MNDDDSIMDIIRRVPEDDVPLDSSSDHEAVLRTLRRLGQERAALDVRTAEMARAALDLGFEYPTVASLLGLSRVQLDAMLIAGRPDG